MENENSLFSQARDDRQGTCTSPRTKLLAFRQCIEGMRSGTPSVKRDVSTLRLEMSFAEQSRYQRAIKDLSLSQHTTGVTPAVMFYAAEEALSRDVCQVEANVGLQPGTMNPIHDGHLLASLGGIIAENLDAVLLAFGSNVPDKPVFTPSQVRQQMARLAVTDRGLDGWVKVTRIRQQAADLLSSDPFTASLVGKSDSERRTLGDIAAFVWLFTANPRVSWTYIVGSDKVSGYGKKDECCLIVHTLGSERARVKVLYFVRAGADIDVTLDIAPYSWMFQLWQRGFFKKASVDTWPISSSAIRQALAHGRNHIASVSLSDCMSTKVLEYIHANEDLLASYIRDTSSQLGNHKDS